MKFSKNKIHFFTVALLLSSLFSVYVMNKSNVNSWATLNVLLYITPFFLFTISFLFSIYASYIKSCKSAGKTILIRKGIFVLLAAAFLAMYLMLFSILI